MELKDLYSVYGELKVQEEIIASKIVNVKTAIVEELKRIQSVDQNKKADESAEGNKSES